MRSNEKTQMAVRAGEFRLALLIRVALIVLLVGMGIHEIVVRVLPGSGIWDDLVLAFLAPLAFWPDQQRPVEWKRGLIPPAMAFMAISLVSGLLNHLPERQFIYGLRLELPYLIAGLAASRLRREDIGPVLYALVGMGIATAAYGIAAFALFRARGGPWHLVAPQHWWNTALLYPYLCGAYPPPGWRLISTFMNDNFYGLWMAMLCPLALALCFNSRRRGAQLALGCGIVLMLVALTWTYSRSAALGFLAGLVVTTLGVSGMAPVLLLPVLAAIPCYLIGPDRYRFNPKHFHASAGGRVVSIHRGIHVFHSHPILGMGPGTRGLADLAYAKIAYETGVLGSAVFLWLLAVACLPAWKLRTAPPEDRRLALGILAALVAMLAAAVGGDVWEIPQMADTFWVLAGLLFALSRCCQEPEIG